MSYVLRVTNTGDYITQPTLGCTTRRVQYALQFESIGEAIEFTARRKLRGTNLTVVGMEEEELKYIVEYASIVYETDKAMLLLFDGDVYPVEQWVPKSIMFDEGEGYFYTYKRIAKEYNSLEREVS